MYKAVAVFCGSNIGNDPIYEQHAKEVGKLLSERKITLIYGGGNTGLMGAIANAVLEHDGKVIGIIPEILKQRERQHEKITELRIVLDMHARKKIMYDLCDAAIIAGYYNHLINHINTMQEQGFLHTDLSNTLAIYDTPDAIFCDWDANKN